MLTARMSSKAKSPLGLIFLTLFIDMVGFGIVIPVLPLYAEGSRFGASPAQLAWIVGIYSLLQLVCAPLFGKWSDRIGRKPVLVVSIIGTAIGFVVLGAANTVWMLLLGRIIDGASGGNISTAHGVHRRRDDKGKPLAEHGARRRGVRARLHDRAGDRRRAQSSHFTLRAVLFCGGAGFAECAPRLAAPARNAHRRFTRAGEGTRDHRRGFSRRPHRHDRGDPRQPARSRHRFLDHDGALRALSAKSALATTRRRSATCSPTSDCSACFFRADCSGGF